MSECAQRLKLDEYFANELSAIIELPVTNRNIFIGLKRLVAQIFQTQDPSVKCSQKLHDLQLSILQKKTIFEEKVKSHRETLRGSVSYDNVFYFLQTYFYREYMCLQKITDSTPHRHTCPLDFNRFVLWNLLLLKSRKAMVD